MSVNLNINKYSLIPYDPRWPQRFDELRAMLKDVFEAKALHIEHVGSTAIPGMMAKPIIDVLVEVETVKNLSQEIEKMVNKGYEWKENYIAPDTLLFFKVDADGEKTENIHICVHDSPKAKQFVVMRDFFRAFPDKASAYIELKKINAKKYPGDYPAYRAAKQSFLAQMEKEAYGWGDSK